MKIKCGETIAHFTKNLMALKWTDKKEVTVLSVFHTITMETIKILYLEKHKPTAILTYNNNMDAFNVGDQILASYPMERKHTKIWYKKFYHHLLNQDSFELLYLVLEE